MYIYRYQGNIKRNPGGNGTGGKQEKQEKNKRKVVSPIGKGVMSRKVPKLDVIPKDKGTREDYLRNINAIKEETAKDDRKNRHHLDKLLEVNFIYLTVI